MLEKTVAQSQRDRAVMQSEIDEMRAQLQQANGVPRPMFDHHQMNSQVNGQGPYNGFGNAVTQEQPRTLPPLMNGSSAPMQGIEYERR